MKKAFFLVAMAILLSSGFAFADGMPSAAERFFSAARGGNVSIVKSMLDANEVTVDIQEAGTQVTALMIGVEKQNLNLVLALIVYRPNPDLKDAQGKTAFTYAKEGGNIAIQNALKQAGLDKE
jgi:ankyrin repeat protein